MLSLPARIKSNECRILEIFMKKIIQKIDHTIVFWSFHSFWFMFVAFQLLFCFSRIKLRRVGFFWIGVVFQVCHLVIVKNIFIKCIDRTLDLNANQVWHVKIIYNCAFYVVKCNSWVLFREVWSCQVADMVLKLKKFSN